MQSDEITLQVDELNNDTDVPAVFTRAQEFANRSVYTGVSHDLILQDKFTMYRTYQKISGNFKGTAKSAVKFSQDFVVTGVDGLASLTSPMIIELSFSVPVGISVADQLIGRQRAIAILDDDTVMVPLMNQLLV
jgi:hypothetical protein